MLRVIGISLRLPSLTPQNWLIEERLSECSETMFTELSAKEETWYSQETNLCVVGLVWCKNHIDVKLIARPSSPLNVITIQNMGYFNAGLYSPGSNISLDEKKSYSHRKGKNFNNHQVLIFCSSRTLFIDWNLIINRIKQSISSKCAGQIKESLLRPSQQHSFLLWTCCFHMHICWINPNVEKPGGLSACCRVYSQCPYVIFLEY